MHSDKNIPPGTWLTIRSLPLETTEQDVQELLAKSRIELPLENIVIVNNHRKFAQAIISLERSQVADLFLRATQMDPEDLYYQGKDEP